MQLFNILKDSLSPLMPVKFGSDHLEEKIQKWADANPAMLNDGQPMLSLGMEMMTNLGHAIDNLYLDGNGMLVVCEAKRGKAPREVISQLLDYAAFVNGLTWADVEKYCKKRQGKSLDDACLALFGRKMPQTTPIYHRLMVLAESFDDQIINQAAYLIGRSTPLVLMRFSYFKADGAEILQIDTALGEIPEQRPLAAKATAPDGKTPVPGADTWLFTTIGAGLPDMAMRHGWDGLNYRVNKQSLPFHLSDWQLALGDCQLRIDSFKIGMLSFRFYFKKDALPQIIEHMDKNHSHWETGFPATLEQPNYETSYAAYSYDVPLPAAGDVAAVKGIAEKIENMAEALIPVIGQYFTNRCGRFGYTDEALVVTLPPDSKKAEKKG